MEEKIIWEGGPHKVAWLWNYVSWYALTAMFGIYLLVEVVKEDAFGEVISKVGLLGVVMAIFFLNKQVASTRYIITDKQIILKFGYLNRQTHYADIYRVKDITIVEGFWDQLFKVGYVYIYTTDRSIGVIPFECIPAKDIEGIRQYLKDRSVELRNEIGYKEVDVNHLW